MKVFKQYQFWVCFVLCFMMFIGSYPFYHDMYIAQIYTFICICLNAFSSIIFSTLLYLKWINRFNKNITVLFLFLLVLQAIGHGVFWIMNWASFFFLPLSAIAFILIIVSYFVSKNKMSKF